VTTKYQIVLIGIRNSYIDKITKSLFKRIRELGLNKNSTILLDKGTEKIRHINNFEVVNYFNTF
jgi:hypothetical protein